MMVTATATACQALWLRGLLRELTCQEEKPVKVFEDNTSTIVLTKSYVLREK